MNLSEQGNNNWYHYIQKFSYEVVPSCGKKDASDERRYGLIIYCSKIESRKYDLTATTVTSYKLCAFLSSFLANIILFALQAFFSGNLNICLF